MSTAAKQDRRTKESEVDHDGIAIATQIYRDGSGGRVVSFIDRTWIEKMAQVHELNYGEVTLLARTTKLRGYGDKYGVVLAVIPGTLKGDLGNGTTIIGDPIDPKSNTYADNFHIETNLEDAIRFHEALGRVITRAQKMSVK